MNKEKVLIVCRVGAGCYLRSGVKRTGLSASRLSDTPRSALCTGAATMTLLTNIALFVFCFKLADFTDPPCVIDLECLECIPENMPLVTSHRATNGSVTAAAGDELALACPGGKFLAFPLLGALVAACEAGRYRVRHDNSLRHLIDLGCQENIFEDVLHEVDQCGAPLQGRAYQMQESGGVRHLAALCFDAERGLPARLHASGAPRNLLRLPPHAERRGPLSILGNFNHMFDAKTRQDADKLYSDDVRMNRRLRELFKHDRYSFADQTLTSAKLLSPHYFDDQNVRVTDFVSNRVAVWRSVASGNLRHVHRDVARFMALSRPHAELDVYSGTHGVLALRTGPARREVFLRAGRRFPVPRYVWTLLLSRRHGRALALVVLNDPFVAVSEIKDAVFCESACGRVSWLHELRRNRNYESPVNGLVFCCNVHAFSDVVTEMPISDFNVTAGSAGMLTELFA